MDRKNLIGAEFNFADLGDQRRVNRLKKVAEQISASSESSLPKIFGNDGQLDGAYRFFNNEAVIPEEVLESHIKCTAQRATNEGKVLIIHDTTQFAFKGEARKGLGRVSDGNAEGFFAHLSFCAALNGQPLGVIELTAFSHTNKRSRSLTRQESQYNPDRESLRWPDAVHKSEERLYDKAQAIHIMDREGDSIELLADLLEHNYRFVIRIAHDRRLNSNPRDINVPKLYETLALEPTIIKCEVPISRRTKSQSSRAHPAREGRIATLEIRAQQLDISPSNSSPAHLPDCLPLNFIEVREVNTPDGEEPILWRLVTTESIDLVEQILAVVDCYRRRWLIEEYFKVLKTGCKYQELQLESAKALLVALSVYAAIAWRLLLLRWLERNTPDAPAISVLSKAQLDLIIAIQKKEGKPLPLCPSVRDVFGVIAKMGGHLKRNGRPGWLVLCRGFDKLLTMEIAWAAARGSS